MKKLKMEATSSITFKEGCEKFSAFLFGVVEAASSSLVTQTKIGGSTEPPIFFYFLAKSLEISRFRNKHNGLVLPYFEG